MTPAELVLLRCNIERCHTQLLEQIRAGLARLADRHSLRVAALLEEELTTRRELEALCTAGNRISAIALCLSMRGARVIVGEFNFIPHANAAAAEQPAELLPRVELNPNFTGPFPLSISAAYTRSGHQIEAELCTLFAVGAGVIAGAQP